MIKKFIASLTKEYIVGFVETVAGITAWVLTALCLDKIFKRIWPEIFV